MFLAKHVQAEWTKLRENYRKCLKRREKATRSGAGSKVLPTCQYFNELSFITNAVSNRPTVSNVPDMFTPPQSPFLDNFETASSEMDTQDLTECSDNSLSTSRSVSTTPTVCKSVNSRKRKGQTSKDLDTLLIQSIQKDLQTPKPQPPQMEQDQDTLFCLSLVQDFKTLSPQKKRKAKIKILEVFCNLNED